MLLLTAEDSTTPPLLVNAASWGKTCTHMCTCTHVWGPDPAAEISLRHRFSHLDQDLNLEKVEWRISAGNSWQLWICPLCLLLGIGRQKPGCALLKWNKGKCKIPIDFGGKLLVCSPKQGDKIHQFSDWNTTQEHTHLCFSPSLVLVPERSVHLSVAPINAEDWGPPKTTLSLPLEGIYLLPCTFPTQLLVLARHLRCLSDNRVIKRFCFLGIINQ